MSIGGVFVLLLLCSLPGVQARCGLFTDYCSVPFNSFLTDWKTMSFEKKKQQIEWASIADRSSLLLFFWVCLFSEEIRYRHRFQARVEENTWRACVSYHITDIPTLQWFGHYQWLYYNCTYGYILLCSKNEFGFKSQCCACCCDQKERSQTQ